MLYLRCGSNYQLRLVEAKEAVGRSSTISNTALRREISAAVQVFNDLDALYRLFESRAYFLSRVVRVSDIYPIVRRYNIPYQENSISKETVYRALIPARRTHIDQLAALIPGAPRDNNPTLTLEQAATAADDLDWSVVTRQRQGYDWYLRRHPQGRHVAEAQSRLERQDIIREEQAALITAVRDELATLTREAIQSYVRGDRAAFERLLTPEFSNRARYITRLQPQPEVISFEIKDFSVHPVRDHSDYYLAVMDVLYHGPSEQQPEYHNRITYAKRDGRWQIIEWRSP